MDDIAIVGAGIGGLTLYHALQQRGLKATLYEAAPALREVGAVLGMPGNGMQVFTRLGLAETISSLSWRLDRVDTHDASGGALQSIDLIPCQRRFGYALDVVSRAALQQVLAAGVAPDDLRLGKSCTHVVLHAGGASMHFADGTVDRASVLIAADGIHSAVRRSLFPTSRLRYAGAKAYFGVVPFELPANLVRATCEVWGGVCRVRLLDVGRGLAGWVAIVRAASGQQADAARARDMLLQQTKAFTGPVSELIGATPLNAFYQTELYDLIPLEAWHRGNVVLLGDAAHATTPNLGQGAAQAIEDAYVLAAALASEETPGAAFCAFQKTRMVKAREVVCMSRWFGKVADVHHPVARRVRNLALRTTPPSVPQWIMNRLLQLAF